jgi:hypothetical protein
MGEGFIEEVGGVEDFQVTLGSVVDFRTDLRNPVEQFA